MLVALHRDDFYISIVQSLKMRLNTHWLLAAGYWLLASPIADRFVDFLQSNKQKTRNSNQKVPLDSDVSFVLSAYFVVTLQLYNEKVIITVLQLLLPSFRDSINGFLQTEFVKHEHTHSHTAHLHSTNILLEFHYILYIIYYTH